MRHQGFSNPKLYASASYACARQPPVKLQNPFAHVHATMHAAPGPIAL